MRRKVHDLICDYGELLQNDNPAWCSTYNIAWISYDGEWSSISFFLKGNGEMLLKKEKIQEKENALAHICTRELTIWAKPIPLTYFTLQLFPTILISTIWEEASMWKRQYLVILYTIYFLLCLVPQLYLSILVHTWLGTSTIGVLLLAFSSSSGIHFFLLRVRSKKQFIVSCSSVKVEYRDITHTMVNIVWLWHLLTDMGLPLSSTPLYCDDLSVHIDNNDIFHECAIYILRSTVCWAHLMNLCGVYLYVAKVIH